MFYTEKEIMQQHSALKQTYEYFIQKKDSIAEFFSNNSAQKFTFLGCGSSYMLAKSGQRLFCQYENTSAIAIAGGDFLMNSKTYEKFVEGSIVICLSRSGKTSEIVRSVKYIKENYRCPVVSVSMEKENALLDYSDLDLVMEWAYDNSVCQTRTVTNLYLALLMLVSCYAKDEQLEKSARLIIAENEVFKERNRPLLKIIAQSDWEKAVVLADGSVCGIAEEGALAFTEISRIPGYYANVLDYRHGPMVLNNKKTVNIVMTTAEDEELLSAMIDDIKKRKGIIITASDKQKNIYGADLHVYLGNVQRKEALGISFIFIMQMLAYEKAIFKGCNPDMPEGLNAYITL